MTTTESYETQIDHDAIQRFVKALDKHKRAEDRLRSMPMNERAFYAEQHLRLEANHARREMVRRAKMHTWNEGHDAVCDVLAIECDEHTNPYVLAGRGTGDE